MTWLVRYLVLARARRLFRECAACTLADYGAGAGAKLRGEIDPGTPLSGRLLIWLMIAEVHRQAREGGRAARRAGEQPRRRAEGLN